MTIRNAKEWDELVRLTTISFEVAQSRMAELRRRETQLRIKLAGLEKPPGCPTVFSDKSDPASRAGADALWQSWINSRRTELNNELARTLVQIDVARRTLAAAHGRHQATEEVARLANTAFRQAKNRRSEGNL
jgi:hypothetical protein